MAKTVLITGASRGIGREMARQFAYASYNVVINYNTSESSALELIEELKQAGYKAIAVKADVSNGCEVQKMVETAKELYGAIDVLINNAAIAQQKLFTDITEEEWDSIFAVNVKGVYNCCKAVVPHMVSQKDGVILNISSVWGMVGASCEVHYSATKAAVIGFSKALAKELGLSGIRVNCIAPGVIDTDMNAGLSPDTLAQLKGETPLARIGTSKDIAALALFLASSEASFITGQVISSNGGFVI
ncbi:MAG: SDR family oxidoreductase [Clostridia bacterium]|jgi:3-oxoacyl-[acyl-carrier protein] reductase|nr:SDR family oxidoreductase [Clostridia bacterium]